MAPVDVVAPGGAHAVDAKFLDRPLSTETLVATRAGRAKRLVYGATALWAIAFSSAAAVGQSLFLERRYDLGNFTQAVWATANGHFLQVTEVGGAQVSRLGIHVDPIIVLLVPLWWVWSSPMLLLVVQALALAAGAVPLFWLARKHLGSERQAGFIVAAYLLYPSVGWNAFHEFHAVALAVPFLLLAIWFLDEDRVWAFSAVAVAAMSCQEQIGALVACLGLWYGWRRGRAQRALAIAATGLAVTAVDFGVVLPHFSHGSPYHGRYAAVGGSVGGIVGNLFAHPFTIVHALDLSDLVGIVFLLLPVFGICLRSSLTLCAAPQVALLVLANGSDWDPFAQNVLPLIPFIFAGTVLALARPRSGRRLNFTAAHALFASTTVALVIASAGVFGALHPFDKPAPSATYLAAERHAVALVPGDAAVAVTNHLGAHFAARRYLYVFPVIRKADWIVVETRDAWLPDLPWLRSRSGIDVGTHDLYWQPALMRGTLRNLKRSPEWQMVFESGGISVFRRMQSSDGS